MANTNNQPPVGQPTAVLSNGAKNTPYLLSEAALLQGFSDPDGDALSVLALFADHGVIGEDGAGSGWVFMPDTGYSGPVTLNYAVGDDWGGEVAASRTFSLLALPTTGSLFKVEGYYKLFFDLSAASYVHLPALPETGAVTTSANAESILKLAGLGRVKELGMYLFPSAADLNIDETYALVTADYAITFKDGYYVAYSEGSITDKSSVALVGRTSNALFLTFRGTDNTGDMAEDVLSMDGHYARYSPLFEGIDTYLAAHPEIKKVYVSGHSLGGEMAMMYLHDHPDTATLKYAALTYEAANKLPPATGNLRFVNFEMKGDPVPDLGLNSNYGKTIHLNYEKVYPVLSDLLQSHYMININTQLAKVINVLPAADKLGLNERVYVDDNSDGVIVTEVTAPLKTLGASVIPVLGLVAEAIWTEDAIEYQRTAYNFKTSFAGDGTLVLRSVYGLDGGQYTITENRVKTVILGDDKVSGSENINISGSAAQWNLTLVGNAGNNILFGGSGADTLIGGADEDWLAGGQGNDVLYGGKYTAIKPQLAAPLPATTEKLIAKYANGMAVDSVDVSYLQGGSGKDTLYGSQGDNDYFLIDANVSKNAGNVDSVKAFYLANLRSDPSAEDYLVFSGEQLGINIRDINENVSIDTAVLGTTATYLSMLNFQVEDAISSKMSYGLAGDEATFILSKADKGLYFDKDGANGAYVPTLLATITPASYGWSTNLTEFDADQILLVGSFNNLSFT